MKKTKCCLCVDNYGVKHFYDTDADHQLDTLKNITKYPWILKGITTVDLPLTWITTRGESTFPCQITSPHPPNVFSTLPQNIHAMNPTNG